MTYNGWTNKETWLVNVYFGDHIEDYMTPEEYEGYVEGFLECSHDLDPFTRDIFNCSWFEINWHELSEHTKEL